MVGRSQSVVLVMSRHFIPSPLLAAKRKVDLGLWYQSPSQLRDPGEKREQHGGGTQERERVAARAFSCRGSLTLAFDFSLTKNKSLGWPEPKFVNKELDVCIFGISHIAKVNSFKIVICETC